MNHHSFTLSFDGLSQSYDGLFQDNPLKLLGASNDVEDDVDNGIGGIPLQADGEGYFHDFQSHSDGSSSTPVKDPDPGINFSTDTAVEVAPVEILPVFAGKLQLIGLRTETDLQIYLRAGEPSIRPRK
jgi:hypothetical protein